jgi:putative redox protein
MTDARPPLVATLEWDGEEQFTGQIGKHEVSIDGSADAAPTPIHLLALSIAGCMAIDLVHILTKGRFTVRSLEAELTGTRADSEPRRFVSIALRFTIDTDAPDDHVARAIALSHDKYCSVWHSMRPDIAFTTSFNR